MTWMIVTDMYTMSCAQIDVGDASKDNHTSNNAIMVDSELSGTKNICKLQGKRGVLEEL